MNWIMKSIRIKLTLSIITAVIILLSVLLVMTYTSLKQYSLNNTLELSATILNEADSKINRFFLEIEYLAGSMKRNGYVYNIELDHMKELFLSTVYARNEYLRAIYLGTKDGKMHEWGYGEGFVDNVPIFPEGYDPRVRPWYKAALEADAFAISEPYIYASIHALGITCAVPVYDASADFVGVLGLDILLKGLSNMINDLQVQKQGKVILLNQNFEILASQFSEYAENITYLETFKDKELIDASEGHFISEIGYREMLTYYKTNKSTGWILLVAIPYNLVMEFFDKTLAIMLLSEIFLMVLLTTIITTMVRKIITEPMGKMISVMREIEHGNVNARILINGEDEFSILGKVFNQLEDIRRSYTSGMEKEIENRTREITSLQHENTRLRIIEEKERIFGKLHDSLGAQLTNIFISNNVAKKAFDSDGKLMRNMLDRIDRNTRQGIKNLKEIIFGTDNSDRIIIDFSRYIGINIQERLKPKNIVLHYSVDNNDEINSLESPLRFEVELLLQEMVSNVLKHAEAEKVCIYMGITDNNLIINLKDDGIGFNYRPGGEKGFGIRGITNRIDRLNGDIRIESTIGAGALFEISIPIRSYNKK